mgnify:CR=1 FL=1|jgi:hypothetical protein
MPKLLTTNPRVQKRRVTITVDQARQKMTTPRTMGPLSSVKTFGGRVEASPEADMLKLSSWKDESVKKVDIEAKRSLRAGRRPDPQVNERRMVFDRNLKELCLKEKC